ncbi:MAG: glycine cleavage system protein H [Desulfobacteraceae bacterium]|nr:MAG: glycine cleavage system protein H [Desulfobacteraceae bacterium]
MELVGLNTDIKTGRSPCLWMQAGVVRSKYCSSFYDCTSCRFDRAMMRAVDENKTASGNGILCGKRRKYIAHWIDKLKEIPSSKRPCIHHMKGRIAFKNCSNDYRCANCEFDQYFYDQYSVHALVNPVDLLTVDGFKIPQGYYIHRGHAWIKIEEGSSVRLGLDDFALRLLGPLDSVEAPLTGKRMNQSDSRIFIRRGGKRANILSPVSGVVTDVNTRLREEGSLANKNPYTDGWFVRLHSENLRNELKDLYIGSETRDFIEKEVRLLYKVIEESGGLINTDGGYLGDDIYGKMPLIGWEMLTGLFLRTVFF